MQIRAPAPVGTTTFDSWASSQKDVTWLAQNSIGRVQDGACNGKCMLNEMEEENTIMTWLLRFLGWMLMVCALNCMFNWIGTISSGVPCIGNFFEDAIGWVICLFSCCVGSALSLITIAIAWLFVRPMIAIPLLGLAVVSVGVAVYVHMTHLGTKGAKQRKAEPYAQPYGAEPYAQPYGTQQPYGSTDNKV